MAPGESSRRRLQHPASGSGETPRAAAANGSAHSSTNMRAQRQGSERASASGAVKRTYDAVSQGAQAHAAPSPPLASTAAAREQPTRTEYQSQTQMRSILSLPPALLYSLARTADLDEQAAVAADADAGAYLPSMALPPPSPDSLASLTGLLVTSIGEHPALPILLGQAFSPPTGSIPAFVVSSEQPEQPFKVTYTSIEDWSHDVARDQLRRQSATATPKEPSPAAAAADTTAQDTATSKSATEAPPSSADQEQEQEGEGEGGARDLGEGELDKIALQLRDWALTEQQREISEQVTQTREAAVMLASHAHARRDVFQAMTAASGAPGMMQPQASSSSSSQHHQPPPVVSGAVPSDPATRQALESAVRQIDLSAYAQEFRRQLETLASGYYAQLHRDALRKLAREQQEAAVATSTTTTSAAAAATTDAPPSSERPEALLPPTQAMHVQAAAASALAANIMAANELAHEAQRTLDHMGLAPPPSVPTPTRALASLAVEPSSIAIASPVGAPASGTSQPHYPRQRRLSPSDERPHSLSPQHLGLHRGGHASPKQHHHHQQQLQQQQRYSPQQQHASVATPPDVAALFLNAQQTGKVTPETRDYLLAYAHNLYGRDASHPDLLPLLHTIAQLHPNHLPTLLLMSCVYYTRGEYQSSLWYNQKLLEYDPNYVEAMSNIGTTLRAMGQWEQAETYWWRAIRLRPTYADAFDNLLGVLCNPQATTRADGTTVTPPPRYVEALRLCDFVEAQVFSRQQNMQHGHAAAMSTPGLLRPRLLPAVIPVTQVHRLQNVFYAKGNLKSAMGDQVGAKDEYEKAIEIVLSLPAWARSASRDRTLEVRHPIEGCSLRDLLLAAFLASKLIAVEADGGVQARADFSYQLGLTDSYGRALAGSLISRVRAGGDHFAHSLVQSIGGQLPAVLLLPDHLTVLSRYLFGETGGHLPCLLEAPSRHHQTDLSQTRSQVNQTTSTVLLTLAKIFQDASAAPSSELARQVNLSGIAPSAALLLPIYYIALALYPSPSTCNNLGILLSTLNVTQHVQTASGRQAINGQYLAMQYYKYGLQRDDKHSHLYTNLGSLYKDMGNLPGAIMHYRKAVECNPNFDVALANLGNALKDTGQVQESVEWYKRAVALNANFPEALCGLANALGGICDWTDRGGVNEDFVTGPDGMLHPTPRTAAGEIERSGYLGKISELVDKQLHDGMSFGAGAMRTAGSIDDWLALVMHAIYNASDERVQEVVSLWTQRLKVFYTDFDRSASQINEGGYIIRLIERLIRRIQHRWYINTYGNDAAYGWGEQLPRVQVTAQHGHEYQRPALPSVLPVPPVPTVLPFHTFTYPVTARETRLISHRTGLRISHSTLNQPWMPQHVYPPPAPPVGGRLKIGYVSSDFGNHPLSHLMQSVFGMHDRENFEVFCYATSPNDKSTYRAKIETEAEHFVDASAWHNQTLVERIVADGIHCLVNLSGYTKGARNEVFAARPSPVQLSYMGFAGTLAAGWCDYFIVDPVVVGPSQVSSNLWRHMHGIGGSGDEQDGVLTPSPLITDFEGDLDPEQASESFVYTEKTIYLPHSYFVTDHRQAWRDEENKLAGEGKLPTPETSVDDEAMWALEEDRRWAMRREVFPDLSADTVIFCNFNQLYKIDPFIFSRWLDILKAVPNSILWLLRFPAAGESCLKQTAERWAGPEIASRVVFTDVASKDLHVLRGRVADLFLDTTECNAHTTAADILWSGTPILTFPRWRHKFASRVAASIALATGYGETMIVDSGEAYVDKAIEFARGLQVVEEPTSASPAVTAPSSARSSPVSARGANGTADTSSTASSTRLRATGELNDLRKKLFLSRERSALFDTRRWVRNLEKGYRSAWNRWADGREFEDSPTALAQGSPTAQSGCIWVEDDQDGMNFDKRKRWLG